MPTTETIHGYPILKAARLPPLRGVLPTRIILVDRGEDHEDDRYVTALLCDGRKGWTGGHYITDLSKALKDFDARVAGEY